MHTQQHIDNLRNHADFVEAFKPNGMTFDMLNYAETVNYAETETYVFGPREVTHDCGAACCALGLTPLNKSLPTPITEDWDRHCENIFGFGKKIATLSWFHQCFSPELPNDPKIISGLMREVADEMQEQLDAQ